MLTWNQSFAVGHEALDAEHRRLVEIINELCAALETKSNLQRLQPLLSALKLGTKDHLKHENAVLRDISAGGRFNRQPTPTYLKAMSANALAEHIAEHERTLGDLESIVSAARPGERCAGSEPCIELKNWFLEHAIKYDAHLKAVFQAM